MEYCYLLEFGIEHQIFPKKIIFIDRQQVQDIVKEQLQKMQSAGVSLIGKRGECVYITMGRYREKHADGVRRELYIENAQATPFYQIVLHGVLPYTSIALNLGENGQDDYLRAIEYGAIPYYQIMDAENFALKDTDSTYYGINYDMWRLPDAKDRIRMPIKYLLICKQQTDY